MKIHKMHNFYTHQVNIFSNVFHCGTWLSSSVTTGQQQVRCCGRCCWAARSPPPCPAPSSCGCWAGCWGSCPPSWADTWSTPSRCQTLLSPVCAENHAVEISENLSWELCDITFISNVSTNSVWSCKLKMLPDKVHHFPAVSNHIL